jgi:ADP-ribose pyrophosphatase YjhB (NUDIX family)
MRREVLEESGLTVEAAELKGILTFPDFDGATTGTPSSTW